MTPIDVKKGGNDKMKKIALLLATVAFFLAGFGIVGGQDVSEDELTLQRFIIGGPESLEPREKPVRKDGKTTIISFSKSLSRQKARLVDDLRTAKNYGDENAAKTIVKELGWDEGQSSGPKVPSPGSLRRAGENGTGEDDRFQTDILISDRSVSSGKPAMASTADGTLYLVAEDFSSNWVDVYRSSDDGQTWANIFSIGHVSYDCIDPSLAVGEGNTTRLLIAYECGSDILVYWEDLDTGAWNFVMVDSGSSGLHPQICVDSPEYTVWYAYIVYADLVSSSNYDVIVSRSLDYGETWANPTEIGSWNFYLYYPQVDIDFGGSNLYITYTNEYTSGDRDVLENRSIDFCRTWDGTTALAFTTDDEYEPRVAATNGGGAVVVAYTRFITGYDSDIQLYYSTNSGENWTWGGLPWTYDDEMTVDLDVSRSYGKIHAAFWQYNDIRYTSADYSNPASWASTQLVNEDNWLSGIYTKPTITVNPILAEEAAMASTDYRFGSPYRVYFDDLVPSPIPLPPPIPPPSPPGTQYTLIVNKTGHGRVALNPDSGTYDAGAIVTLTAIADSGWVFSGWSGNLTGSNNPDTITMDSDKTVTATFSQGVPQYTLTVKKTGHGRFTLNPAGGTYDEGRVVTLTAIADSGWVFSGWSGDLTGSNNPDTIAMDSDKTVTATFSQGVLKYTLTVNKTGHGSVTLNPAGGTYYLGRIVALTAIADSGWVFSGWSGDLTGSNNPDTIIMDSSKSVTASFLDDVDKDSISSEEEDGAPNGGDGNQDNIPDSQQSNVTSLQTFDDQAYVALECPVGAAMSNVEAIDNPSPTDAPTDVIFQYGFFEFIINDVEVGSAMTLTLYLPAGTAASTYYKYGPTPNDKTEHWYEFLYDGQTGAEINDNVITLHFVNGQRGDDDLDNANGTIVDAGGPGFTSTPSPTPAPSDDGGGGGCFIALTIGK